MHSVTDRQMDRQTDDRAMTIADDGVKMDNNEGTYRTQSSPRCGQT